MKEYFRYLKNRKGSFGAIGVKEVEGGKFKIGISLCSKGEPRFDKKIARELVNQRIEKSEEYNFFDIIDYRAYDMIKKTLPHYSTVFSELSSKHHYIEMALEDISDDILMDYAKQRYYEVKK